MRPITILILVLFSASVFADRVAESLEKKEKMDAEPYAVTPTSEMPPELTSPDAACLSQATVHNYENAARPAIAELKVLVKNPATKMKSLYNIRKALQDNGLSHGTLGNEAKYAPPYLAHQGYVNLLACPGWAAKLKISAGARPPLGALITYVGPRFNSIKMMTDEGCAGNGGSKPGSCRPGLYGRVTGVWVKLID
jgi:hypothetical protein